MHKNAAQKLLKTFHRIEYLKLCINNLEVFNQQSRGICVVCNFLMLYFRNHTHFCMYSDHFEKK